MFIIEHVMHKKFSDVEIARLPPPLANLAIIFEKNLQLMYETSQEFGVELLEHKLSYMNCNPILNNKKNFLIIQYYYETYSIIAKYTHVFKYTIYSNGKIINKNYQSHIEVISTIRKLLK